MKEYKFKSSDFKTYTVNTNFDVTDLMDEIKIVEGVTHSHNFNRYEFYFKVAELFENKQVIDRIKVILDR